MVQLRRILCYFGFMILGAVSAKKDEEQLLLVHTIWRHGWDTPPYDFVHPIRQQRPRESLPKGLLQCFELGKVMRERYIENNTFIHPSNRISEVYIRSIDYNRSLTSASAMMAGMFPGNDPVLEKTHKWPSNWIPMPIHTVPVDQDLLLNMGVYCPTAYNLDTNLAYIPEYNKTLRENQEFFDYLSNNTGRNVTRDIIGLVWASLTELPESEIPHWVNKSLLDRMLYLAKREQHFRTSDSGLVRFRGGPLATEIYNRMEAKWRVLHNKTALSANFSIDPLIALKYYGYSCRGMPILWQLATLGERNLTEDRIPRFSSCLVYELWKRGDKPYVSVLYHDGSGDQTRDNFEPIQIKGCPKLPARCPLATVRKVIAPYFLGASDNWYKECGLIPPTSSSNYSSLLASSSEANYRYLSIIFGIIIIILTTFVIIQQCILMRPGRKSANYTEEPDEQTRLVASSKVRAYD